MKPQVRGVRRIAGRSGRGGGLVAALVVLGVFLVLVYVVLQAMSPPSDGAVVSDQGVSVPSNYLTLGLGLLALLVFMGILLGSRVHVGRGGVTIGGRRR